MSKLILNLSGFFVLVAYVLAGATALASEPLVANNLDPLLKSAGVNVAPVVETSVANQPQLTVSNPEIAKNDQQTALSVQMLQGLNDRYKCCITAMEIKVANEPTSVSPADLEQLKQLTQSFRADLIALSNRVEKVEKVALAQSEVSQFSTTTKLVGEVIVGISDVFGGGRAGGGPLNANAIVADRVRLNLRTTFDGKDLLQTRLQARNSNSFQASAGTNQVRLGFEGSEENAVGIQLLQYQKPISEQTKLIGTVVGNELDLYFKNFNPVLAPAGTGAISRFGRYNPIYRLSAEGAGIAVDHKFNKQLGISLAYSVPRLAQPSPAFATDIAADPATGVFGGSNLFFSQIAYSPTPNLDLGFIFARSYSSNGAGVSGLNGTAFANSPFGGVPTSANHYSVLASGKLSSSITLSGWAGLTNANREGAAGGSADIFNGAATLAFDNIGGAGNTLGFVVGLPPKVTGSTVAARVNRDTPIHLETFYKYQISKNLYVTPGLVMILNPEGNAANPTLFLGTIRTTFNF
jgi:hypothetical protein